MEVAWLVERIHRLLLLIMCGYGRSLLTNLATNVRPQQYGHLTLLNAFYPPMPWAMCASSDSMMVPWPPSWKQSGCCIQESLVSLPGFLCDLARWLLSSLGPQCWQDQAVDTCGRLRSLPSCSAAVCIAEGLPPCLAPPPPTPPPP